MRRKVYITIDSVEDSTFCEKVRQIGIREVARGARISPGMISLFLSGKTAMAKDRYDAIRRVLARTSFR